MLPKLTDLDAEDLCSLINEEVQSSMRDELSYLKSHFENIEVRLKSLSDCKATISAVVSHTIQHLIIL